MARINEFRKARRGRRASLVVAALLLAVAVLQVGTSSALVPADLVDAYADAGHVQQRVWFARGDTVYMRGGLAGSTQSYRFLVTDPNGTLVHDSNCQVRNVSATDAFDQFTLAANAVLGAGTGWTERFVEWSNNTTCTDPDQFKRDRTSNFRVAQLYAFDNVTDRNNCGGATPGASWPASCANALTTFTPGTQVYVRVLGLGALAIPPGVPYPPPTDPSPADVSTTWTKPTGPACTNTAGTDRPDANATDGRLDTSYPPLAPEVPDNAANCGPMTELGAWTLTLDNDVTGVKHILLPAFTVATPPLLTPTVSTTIHNSADGPVTTVPVGTIVHDFVSVSGGAGNPVPTGTVTIDWFLNGACAGSPAVTSGAFGLNAAGQVDATAFSFTVNTAGQRAFLAHYSGNGTYSASDGPCEKLTVVDANIQITPNGTNPVGTSHVFVGHVNVNDGSGAGFVNAPDGTQISFTIDMGPGSFTTPNPCTTAGGSGSCQITLTSSTAGATIVSAHTTVSVGGVSLTRNTDSTDGNSGPATKNWADDTVTTVVRDSAGNDVTNTTLGGGTVVHDEATVTRTSDTPAAVPNPTGSVTFTLFDSGTCNGNVLATDPNKPLDASGTATSANFTTPAVIGPFSYLAHYNGDANYPAHDGPCEAFNFDGVPPVTTIVLDPAQPDTCCWYVFAVKPTVSATDVGTGVLETRCVLDPATPPASFNDLPPGMCPYLAPSSWVVTDGVHTLYAGSIDKATPGNTDLVQVTFKIDRTPPTSQVDPLPQFQPSPGPFTVSWSGSDNLSGIKDFDVRYRTAPAGGSFGPYTQWFTDTTLTSALFTPTPGSTTCFSVRARDRACWEQPTYSPEVCTTAPYDDPSLTRTGSWSTVTGSGYFGPGVSRSTTYNNKLTLTGLRASVVGVLATKQPGGGTIELRWNGSLKATVNLTAATIQKKQLLTFNLGSVQTGTLDIIQTTYGTVDIDAAGAWKAS